MCEKIPKGCTLSSAVNNHQAELLLQDADRLLYDDEQIVLKFSKGWLGRFKKRSDLRLRSAHGMAMSGDNDATHLYVPRLLRILSTFPMQISEI